LCQLASKETTITHSNGIQLGCQADRYALGAKEERIRPLVPIPPVKLFLAHKKYIRVVYSCERKQGDFSAITLFSTIPEQWLASYTARFILKWKIVGSQFCV